MNSALCQLVIAAWLLLAGSQQIQAQPPEIPEYSVQELSQERHVMPWLCLSRCGSNDTQIKENVKQVVGNKEIFDFASFEKYNLGPHSSLVNNNFTNVGIPFNSAGVYTIPMVSSYPYPKDFLHWMRTVFANPKPFMRQVLKQCTDSGYNAVNIDWEPTTNKKVTPKDAADYANFLNALAKFLHQYDIQVTVDVATWSPIWNLTLINKTEVDWIVTMSTYTDNQTAWMREFRYAVETIAIDRLMIGLETVTSDGNPYSTEVLKERFQQLENSGIKSIGLWRSPIPDEFFPFLKEFKRVSL